jgi:CheY-like chemotaxis protein
VQLQQVILNLAINARDAMTPSHGGSDGGQLVLASKVVSFSEEDRPERLKAGTYLEVSVRDTGCGMSPDICSHIFEPFYTTKPVGKGSGMGLAMVYGIVSNHGGALMVRSTPAQGSCFSIYLPLCAQPAVSNVILSSAPHARVNGGRILVAEDQPDIREVTAQMLRALGYVVATAADGQEAVEYFKSHQQEIDLVILDMIMPGMGARDCFREIRRLHPDVRAVLTTGYVNNNAVQEILNDGMSGFMQKPYHLSKLSEVVAAALR